MLVVGLMAQNLYQQSHVSLCGSGPKHFSFCVPENKSLYLIWAMPAKETSVNNLIVFNLNN